MKFSKRCHCLLAVIAAVCTILVITFFCGYTIGNWTLTSRLAAGVIVIVALLCMRCRLMEDEAEGL